MKFSHSLLLLSLTTFAAASLKAGQPAPLADVPDPTADAEKAGFVIPEGFEVNLWASEPMLHKPSR